MLCLGIALPAWFLGKNVPIIGSPVFGILFGMNLFNVLKVGSQSLAVMLFTISASFIMAFAVGKSLRLDGKITTLIGVGTSICGGSAIAAMAAIGLNTNIKKLLSNGFKPIFLGLCCWLAVASTSLLVQMVSKMW